MTDIRACDSSDWRETLALHYQTDDADAEKERRAAALRRSLRLLVLIRVRSTSPESRHRMHACTISVDFLTRWICGYVSLLKEQNLPLIPTILWRRKLILANTRALSTYPPSGKVLRGPERTKEVP